MKGEISVKDWSIGLLQIVLHTGTCGIHLAPKDVFITGNSDQTIYGGSLRTSLVLLVICSCMWLLKED